MSFLRRLFTPAHPPVQGRDGITKQDLETLRIRLMAELNPQLMEIRDQLRKVKAEVSARAQSLQDKITSLEEIIANGGLTEESKTLLAEIKAELQVLDDMNPDATPPA